MAKKNKKKKKVSNIKMNPGSAQAGLNLDSSVSQVGPGKVTYALNAAIENFDPVGIISDAVTNVNRMHTKRVMTLKERMCNQMTEKEKQKLKDKLKNFMDYLIYEKLKFK